MNILCIMHADFETPGTIEQWAQKNNYPFKIIKPYNGECCLSEDDFDFLIVLGGPQSPNQLEQFPYLKDEIQLIKNAASKHAIILGFCLGAQLIGAALGAKTEKSPEKEVGVFPITLTSAGKQDPLLLDLAESFPVIHWHNDMPGITDDAEILAYSQGCPRQIIRYAKNIYGFQCHLEINYDGMQTMIDACPHDLAPSLYTQTAAELLSQNYQSINASMVQILDRLINLNSNKQPHKQGSVFVVSEWLAKDGCDDELYQQFKQLMATTEKNEPGCLSAHAMRQIIHPASPGKSQYKIVLLQEYRNQQAFELHCTADYVKKAFAQLVDGQQAIVQAWTCRLFGETE